MTEYVAYHLGPDACQYMRQRLSLGHDLAQGILKRVRLETGTVVVHFPRDVAIDRTSLLAFTSGGKLPSRSGSERRAALGPERTTVGRGMTPVQDTRELLASLITRSLSRSAGRFCMFEDANARMTDDRISTSTTPFVHGHGHRSIGHAAEPLRR